MTLKNPSIVLLTIDSLRPDHLGCYGYPRDTSPQIDRIAKESILFSGAISQGTYTLSSLTSLATSSFLFEHDLYEHMLGVTLNDAIPTCAEILKDKGYNTAFFGPWMISNIKNFHRGFDLCDIGPVEPIRFFSQGLKRLSFDRYNPTGAEAITTKAIRWLNIFKKEPFFLWIHYFDAHPPYRVRAPFDRMFVEDSFQKKEGQKSFVSTRLIGMGGIPKFMADHNESDVGYYICKYDGAIRFIDTQIGRLCEFMKKNGIYEETLFVITSDHGEFLGENDLYFCHGGLPLEPLIKIPLIIKCLEREENPIRIDQQVPSMDILPTVLGLLGISLKRKMRGRDLSSFLTGKTYCETPFSFFWARHICAVRHKDWKLIYVDRDALIKKRDELEKMVRKKGIIFEWKSFLLMQLQFLFESQIPQYLFYDLEKDPQEKNAQLDFVSGDAFIRARSLLDAWREKIRDKGGAAAENFGNDDFERLKSLGYVQ